MTLFVTATAMELTRKFDDHMTTTCWWKQITVADIYIDQLAMKNIVNVVALYGTAAMPQK